MTKTLQQKHSHL